VKLEVDINKLESLENGLKQTADGIEQNERELNKQIENFAKEKVYIY
jgi:hypothetical protein